MPYRKYRLLIILFHLLGTTAIGGCIREKSDNCLAETIVYVSVKDSSAQLLSSSGGGEIIDNIKIYIYGADLKLGKIVNFSRYDLENRTPVQISFPAGDYPKVIVWGNLNGAQEIVEADLGKPISSGLIKMLNQDNYSVPPDHLYYGSKELTDENIQEVVISSWVGRMNITVRGIEELRNNPNDYYFKIESIYNGYDFNGNPIAGEVSIKSKAEVVVKEGEELLAHEPINMIAYPSEDRKHTITVSVYKTSITGDQLLGTAVTDVEGHKIATHPGMNTNVLIDFNQQTGMDVHIKVTPWEYIYQWTLW